MSVSRQRRRASPSQQASEAEASASRRRDEQSARRQAAAERAETVGKAMLLARFTCCGGGRAHMPAREGREREERCTRATAAATCQPHAAAAATLHVVARRSEERGAQNLSSAFAARLSRTLRPVGRVRREVCARRAPPSSRLTSQATCCLGADNKLVGLSAPRGETGFRRRVARGSRKRRPAGEVVCLLVRDFLDKPTGQRGAPRKVVVILGDFRPLPCRRR